MTGIFLLTTFMTNTSNIWTKEKIKSDSNEGVTELVCMQPAQHLSTGVAYKLPNP
jgi:hypothetical protein